MNTQLTPPAMQISWQAQYTEPPGPAAARVVAAGTRLPFVWQAQHLANLEGRFRGRHSTLCTTHHTPLILQDSSHTTHHTLLSLHHSSHTTHLTPLITHHSSRTTHHTLLITHHSSHSLFSSRIFPSSFLLVSSYPVLLFFTLHSTLTRHHYAFPGKKPHNFASLGLHGAPPDDRRGVRDDGAVDTGRRDTGGVRSARSARSAPEVSTASQQEIQVGPQKWGGWDPPPTIRAWLGSGCLKEPMVGCSILESRE